MVRASLIGSNVHSRYSSESAWLRTNSEQDGWRRRSPGSTSGATIPFIRIWSPARLTVRLQRASKFCGRKLIARGLTNREIAPALVIAERTADTHVSSLLGKLGAKTRSQIATGAVEHGQGPKEAT